MVGPNNEWELHVNGWQETFVDSSHMIFGPDLWAHAKLLEAS